MNNLLFDVSVLLTNWYEKYRTFDGGICRKMSYDLLFSLLQCKFKPQYKFTELNALIDVLQNRKILCLFMLFILVK